jgi:uncharacterized iron-regulated membrane protein
MALRRSRPGLRWLHRWLGLTLGLVYAVIALSGTLLLFQPLYFEWAHGTLIPDEMDPQPGSVDAWVANGRAAVPALGEPIAIWRPHVSHNVSDAGMMIFAGREPGGLGNMGFVGVLIAPASGAVLGTIDVDRSPAYAPLFLHRDLWAGATGRLVNGVVAVASLVTLGLGLYLWWPGRRRLGRKLSPLPWRRTLQSARRLHDWTGAITLVALIALSASGLYLVQPRWVEPLLAAFPKEKEKEPDRTACRGEIGFDAALSAARALVPGSAWTAIYPKGRGSRIWNIALAAGDDADAEHGGFWATADLACGTIELRESPATRSARDTAEIVLTGLHDGSLFGRVGEIVVAILGIVPVLLAITGLMLWSRKRAFERTRPARPASGSPRRISSRRSA